MTCQTPTFTKRYPVLLQLIALIVLGGSVSAGQALELYRCTRNGLVEFRQTACPEGEQAITEVVDQSKGIAPIEPGLRLVEPKREKPEKAVKQKKTKPVNTRCWKTEQRLARVERRLRAGYKPSQSEGLHRKQAEYEDYLRRFCQD